MIPIRKGKQLDLMRNAGRVASEILKKTAREIRPGVTTREVDEAAAMITWLASRENSFTTAAVFDLSGGRATY